MRLGMNFSSIADPAAAIFRRVGVEALAIAPRSRHPDAVIFAWHRREIADDDAEVIGIAAAAKVGDDAFGCIRHVDPLEAVRIAIELVRIWHSAPRPPCSIRSSSPISWPW